MAGNHLLPIWPLAGFDRCHVFADGFQQARILRFDRCCIVANGQIVGHGAPIIILLMKRGGSRVIGARRAFQASSSSSSVLAASSDESANETNEPRGEGDIVVDRAAFTPKLTPLNVCP